MRVMFGERTVPGAQVDGRKVHRTSAIFRALDDMVTEPRLFPADPDHRALVERAETWGAGPFQDIGRRLVWFHMRGRRRSCAAGPSWTSTRSPAPRSGCSPGRWPRSPRWRTKRPPSGWRPISRRCLK
ncbi:MAG: hypothetical protein ACSLFR_15230 [Solirubrobacteraceae bacterium]